MTMKSGAKFEEKLTCGSKYNMRNLIDFHPATQKPENFYEFWAEKYRGVIFHDTGQWCKIWINPDLVVSKMAWGIGWTFIREHKSKKLYIDGFFFVKSI